MLTKGVKKGSVRQLGLELMACPQKPVMAKKALLLSHQGQKEMSSPARIGVDGLDDSDVYQASWWGGIPTTGKTKRGSAWTNRNRTVDSTLYLAQSERETLAVRHESKRKGYNGMVFSE